MCKDGYAILAGRREGKGASEVCAASGLRETPHRRRDDEDGGPLEAGEGWGLFPLVGRVKSYLFRSYDATKSLAMKM